MSREKIFPEMPEDIMMAPPDRLWKLLRSSFHQPVQNSPWKFQPVIL